MNREELAAAKQELAFIKKSTAWSIGNKRGNFFWANAADMGAPVWSPIFRSPQPTSDFPLVRSMVIGEERRIEIKAVLVWVRGDWIVPQGPAERFRIKEKEARIVGFAADIPNWEYCDRWLVAQKEAAKLAKICSGPIEKRVSRRV